jgi:biopolymer transport protein TolR
MALKKPASRPPDSDINITPLIDIVLVMLIIFMVLTPIKIQEMSADLPKKTEVVEQQDLPEDQLMVAAYADGTIALNKRRLSFDQLRDELHARLHAKQSRVVFVDAAADASYDTVVRCMDIARDAGAERVALATMKPEGPAEPVE